MSELVDWVKSSRRTFIGPKVPPIMRPWRWSRNGSGAVTFEQLCPLRAGFFLSPARTLYLPPTHDRRPVASDSAVKARSLSDLVARLVRRPAASISRPAQRWCPKPIPSASAFCRNDPSLRFICFAIFATGVRAFECCFSSLMSAAVYGFRIALFALATSCS
jgi:hypothetical protein